MIFVILHLDKFVSFFVVFRSGASNIIFSNGLLDPWSGGGVLHKPNERISIVIIPDGAHHLDLRGTNKADPISVTIARQRELDIIKQWIKEYIGK